MIPRSFIVQMVSMCDIEDVLSSYITVKRMGRSSKALCPFHSEKTPSFVIYPDNQSFYCFGCGAGGDVISFIMRVENVEYVEAVKILAARVGLAVPDGDNDDVVDKKAVVYEINKEAAKFFHKCLRSPIGKDGMDYFKSRRLSDKAITEYGLGYAPNSWDSLLCHLKQASFTEEDILASAVVAKGQKGNLYDQFRNRVIFPIIDLRKNVIGFGGRVLDDSKPKYLNSPDTPVFKKSRNLFSLNFAKNSGKDTIILAEGYMDVIAISSAGFRNTVATLGTSLTEEQARLMGKYAKDVVIAYDSDKAGQAATLRAINLLADAGLRARVLKLEGAKDPDEYIKSFGAKRFEILLSGALDVFEHQLTQIRESCDMETAEGKIRYLKQAIQVLCTIRNPLDREVYGSVVASASGVKAETVKTQTEGLMKKKQVLAAKREWRDIESNKAVYKDRINPQKGQNLKEAVAEEGIIAFFYKNSDYYSYLLSSLTPEDFVTDFNRRVYTAICGLITEGVDVSLTALGSVLSQEEIGGVSAILARNSEQTNTVELLDDYVAVLKQYGEKLKPDEIIASKPEGLEEYRQRLMVSMSSKTSKASTKK